jgi:IS1 family transposase
MGEKEKNAQIFYEAIPSFFLKKSLFFTGYRRSYATLIAREKHFAIGKGSGLTAYIERFNCTLRQRYSKLVKKL